MSDVQMLDEPYEGKVTTPDDYFKGSIGVYEGKKLSSVKICFAPQIAPFVQERRWHHTQSFVKKGDGSIVLSLEVGLTPELVQWILGFGAKAEVMEPCELRDKVMQEASEIVSAYQFKNAG